MNLKQAFKKFKEIKDVEIYEEQEANDKYHRNTLGIKRVILGALRPSTVEQIQEIVKIANHDKVPLYTFSMGHNWGYGSALPAVDGCILLDLSRMKKVIEFNEELGYVTVEPGVTQQELYDYMQEKGLSFMIPTTGGGPTGSLVGNALDKGYGITPYEDHFNGVLALEAVLPNSELYRSTLTELGGQLTDKIFKWSSGPYLDGLFTQSNFGIVTQVTIAMAKKPEMVGQVLIYVDNKDFNQAVKSTYKIKEKYGSMIGGINLMNVERILAMVELGDSWKINGVVPEKHLHAMAKKRKVPDWAVLVGIYSPKDMMKIIQKGIKKEFRSYANRILYFTRPRLNFVKSIFGIIPSLPFNKTLETIDMALQVLEGKPSEVALPLAYIKNPKGVPKNKALHPDEDGCGELWYDPVLPKNGELIGKFVKEVKKIMTSYGFEPMITLTGVTQRYYDSNIPIIFNRSDPKQVKDAHDCMKDLNALAKKIGVSSHRFDIVSQRYLFDNADAPVFTLSQQIKKAIDPNNILSPGRYIKYSKTKAKNKTATN